MATRLWLACCLCSFLSVASASERDPWEGFNRKVFRFNDKVDRYAFKPVAKGYRAITPQPVDDGVTNFFSNLDDVLVTVNAGLQGKFKQAGQDLARFGINSTLGVAGLFDVASRFGLPKHDEDFGQTLGVWGVPQGAYVVLPFLGPSTLRDIPGKVVDSAASPKRQLWNMDTVVALNALELIDWRADLLSQERTLDEAADPYTILREIYLQRRDFLIKDGQVEDEFLDDTDDGDESSGETNPGSESPESTNDISEEEVSKAPEQGSPVSGDVAGPETP